MIIANLTLDTESAQLLLVYLNYVHATNITVHGLVSDAALTGLLSQWADPALTITTGDAIRTEVAREDVRALGPEVPLMLEDTELRERAVRRAEEIAAAMALPSERLPDVYLAAARVGLRKFAAQIAAQEGRPS